MEYSYKSAVNRLKYLLSKEKSIEDFGGLKEQLRDLIYLDKTKKGVDAKTALLEANRQVLPYKFQTTSEYHTKLKPWGNATISDIESGMIYDNDLKKYKKATNIDLIKQLFKKQKLTPAEEKDFSDYAKAIDDYKLGKGLIPDVDVKRSRTFLYKKAGIFIDFIKANNDLNILAEKNPEAYEKAIEINNELEKSGGLSVDDNRFPDLQEGLKYAFTQEKDSGIYETVQNL